jgi:hypothetical protein
MDLQEWAALGEILAAVAVVVTLVYVARQVRQGSSNIHNATSWAITQALAQLNTRISSDREFSDLWLRGLRDPESLDGVEAERFRAYAMDMLNLAVYVDSHPTPEHEFFVPYLAHLAQEEPGFRRMIELVGGSMPGELIGRLLPEGEAPPGRSTSA